MLWTLLLETMPSVINLHVPVSRLLDVDPDELGTVFQLHVPRRSSLSEGDRTARSIETWRPRNPLKVCIDPKTGCMQGYCTSGRRRSRLATIRLHAR